MAKRRRRSKRAQNNMLVLELLILVVVVLALFEGRLIYTMLHQSSSAHVQVRTVSEEAKADAEASSSSAPTANAVAIGLAGFTAKINSAGTLLPGTSSASSTASGDDRDASDTGTASSAQETTSAVNAEYIEADYVVPEQAVSVDDSYFADAVFIGDSRMEGFRNASGITQGDFLTSVGMTLTSFATETVSTSEGQITVYQGLSGRQYSKVYLMLGANDLGFYPMSEFLSKAEGVFEEIHELQPDAVIYICSVIYVEEDKVVTDYVNNANVQEVNGYLLQACQELSYCYYLNLNEIFSNGYHALISGASADGVHLNAPYLTEMLDYLKSHYLVVEPISSGQEEQTDTQSDEA